MQFRRSAIAITLGCSMLAVSACQTAPPPPTMARPASFITLGVEAPYLNGPVVGGNKVRAAKMRAAKIKPLSPGGEASYMASLDNELRRQTAGMGLDIFAAGGGIVIRIPAGFTFDPGSAAVKPQMDATLLEITRTVKSRNQTYVDVLAHTDTSGSDKVNQTLSDKRAAAVASYLGAHGVAKARIASKGYGKSAPLYSEETDDSQKAANRRIEIRLMPYTG